ncbi:Serum response factor like protein [Cucumispora dikerogammari]|nr:Serum response factor like protein [Cucumispora dikerogammari]
MRQYKKKLLKYNYDTITNDESTQYNLPPDNFKYVGSQTKVRSKLKEISEDSSFSSNRTSKVTGRHISNDYHRSRVFSRRMKSIMKKSAELALTTDTQLVVMCVCEQKSVVHTFSTHKFKPFIEDFKEMIEEYLKTDEFYYSDQPEFFGKKSLESIVYPVYFYAGDSENSGFKAYNCNEESEDFFQ